MTEPDGERTRRTQAERSATANRRMIRAAIQLIARQGYTKTTLAQVGKEAGYTGGLVSHLRGLGYPVAIASEGLDIYIDPVLEVNNVEYVNLFYNEATGNAEGEIVPHYPHPGMECEDCGNCKAGLVKALRADGNYVVFDT